ncbi:hypothetical protein MHYP_G00278460 [Metynnis hypsauchen]
MFPSLSHSALVRCNLTAVPCFPNVPTFQFRYLHLPPTVHSCGSESGQQQRFTPPSFNQIPSLSSPFCAK